MQSFMSILGKNERSINGGKLSKYDDDGIDFKLKQSD